MPSTVQAEQRAAAAGAREALQDPGAEISYWGYVLAQSRTALSSSAADLLAREDLGEVFLGLRRAAQGALADIEAEPQARARVAGRASGGRAGASPEERGGLHRGGGVNHADSRRASLALERVWVAKAR